MIGQVFNRVNDIRDLCEKRCEQLRHFIRPVYRPMQYVHPLPLPHNETFNSMDTTSTIVQQHPINEHVSAFDTDSTRFSSSKSNNESTINYNAKIDKKQR